MRGKSVYPLRSEVSSSARSSWPTTLTWVLLALAANTPAGAAERRFREEMQQERPGSKLGMQTAPLAQAASSDGPFELRSAAARLQMDAFGSFGSASAGSDAWFDDGNRRAGTVFEYMAHVKGIGFLDSEALLRPQSFVSSRRESGALISSYELGTFRFELRSELVDCTEEHCAQLRQDWTVTNIGTSPAPLLFSFYLDGDLFFAGVHDNDHGASVGDSLYQFDEGGDPAAPSSFLGLSAEAPLALRSVREVGEYSDQRRRLRNGIGLHPGLVRADGSDADRDGDGLSDEGYDVSLALSHDFGMLGAGESVTLDARLQWGIGAPNDVKTLFPDAGPDLRIECEGQAGTLVTLDGSASLPFGTLSAWRWTVDGLDVGEGEVLPVLLQPGEHVVALTIVDGFGRSETDTSILLIEDTSAPLVHALGPLVLDSPDGRLVLVEPPVSLVDVCDDHATLRFLSVTSDELPVLRAARTAAAPRSCTSASSRRGERRAQSGQRGGPGAPHVDLGGLRRSFPEWASLDGEGRLLLQNDSLETGDGRVYRVLAEASDGLGNSVLLDFEVHVPRCPDVPVTDSGFMLGVDL